MEREGFTDKQTILYTYEALWLFIETVLFPSTFVYQFEREETKKLNEELKELVANQSIRLGNLEKISLAKGTRRNSNSEKNIIQNQKNRLISFLKKYNFL